MDKNLKEQQNLNTDQQNMIANLRKENVMLSTVRDSLNQNTLNDPSNETLTIVDEDDFWLNDKYRKVRK
jgi:hypothetical protein